MVDPQLGQLTRRRGMWRGEVALTGGRHVPLAVIGGRGEPDTDALALARTIPIAFATSRAEILAALDEHRAPYLDAATAAVTEPEPEPVYGAVIQLDRMLTIELGYRVAWDEEHTLGARLRDGQLVELNGSVLEP